MVRSPGPTPSAASTTKLLSYSRSPEPQASNSSWATHQLGEFLSALSHFSSDLSAIQGAVDLAASALEADIGAVLVGDDVAASIGFPRGRVPLASVLLGSMTAGALDVDGLGSCRTISVTLEDGRAIMLARSGADAFSSEEGNRLRATTRSLDLTVRLLRLAGDEPRPAGHEA